MAPGQLIENPVTPRGFESLVETLFGLARDGRTNRHGCPDPLQLAVLAAHFRDEAHTASRRLRVALSVLAPAGRAVGYRPTYPAAYGG